MKESDVKQAMGQEMRAAMAHAVVLRLEDRLTPGVPDFNVNWVGRTVYLEVKVDGGILSGPQRLMLERLDRAAHRALHVDVTVRAKTWVVAVYDPHGTELFFASGTRTPALEAFVRWLKSMFTEGME